HDLEGYSSAEVASIVGAPARTVRRRLSQARERLREALGEDDLIYLNEPLAPGTRAAGGRQWAWLPLDQMHALEARLARGGAGCWVLGVGNEPTLAKAPDPTPNTGSKATEENPMERREFLRQAAVGAAGLMLPETEKEVVDSRLTQK